MTTKPKHLTQRLRLLGGLLVVVQLAASCTGGSSSSPDATAADPPSSTQASAQSATTSESPAVPQSTVDTSFTVMVPEPDDTPIDVDRAVRIGTLDNGLTYYLRENDSPGGRVELRLVVNAGSLQQEQPGTGLAHFVEHMLFNGTTAFPENELDKALQDLGLAIGPDVNAFTSFDETVYSLSVASRDRGAVEQGFDILSEWASAALLQPDDVINERGVVREERRARTESAGGRQFDAFLDAYTIGSDYFGASPIGTAEGILATTAGDARRFYDRWYRPDLIAVVVVGDLGLDDMEAEVISRFDDFESRSDNVARETPSAPPVDQRWVQLLLDEETSARRVSLDYWIPTWNPGTVGGERLIFIESVLGAVINQRLNDAVDLGEIAAVSPSAGPFDLSRQIRFLGFNFGGSDLAVATQEVVTELRRMEINGFTDTELDRVISEFRGFLDQDLDGLGTRQDSEFATAYVDHFLSGSEIDDAASTHARLNEILDELTSGDLTNHYRYLMSVSAPLLAGMGQTAATMPTVDELNAALDAALTADVSGDGQRATAAVVSALMEVPDPIEAVEANELRDLPGFEMVFANGARALFTESGISEGAVNLFALADGGWSTLTVADAQLASLATSAVQQSGIGELDSVQLSTFLAGSVVTLSPLIDEVDEGFVGSASVDDLELLFQLLHLSVTAPRIDAAAFASAVEAAEAGVRGSATDPQTLSIIELFDARFGSSDWPRIVPNADALAAATAAETLRVYQDRLGDVDDLVVTVAGDVDGAVVADLFERYIGSLPAGEPDGHVDLWPPPPSGVIERTVSAGSTDAGAGVDFLFTVELEVNDRVALVAELVGAIVRSRLFDAVREELGASYGANVFVSNATNPDDVIETFVLASGDPDRLELISETILESIHDLATNGPSEDEFDRARAILSSDYELVGNFDLLEMLIATGRKGDLDPFTRGEAFEVISEISRREVADLSAKMFPLDRWIEVTRG